MCADYDADFADNTMPNWDLHFFRAINGLKKPWLDRAMWLFSFIPSMVIGWSVIIFRLSWNHPQKAWEMAVLMSCSFIFIILFKEIVISKIFFRKRPYLELAQTKNMGTHFTDSSFPSSHTAAMTALSIIYLSYNHTYFIFFALWTFLVAFSRIYTGMHYPSDVAAGLAYGGIVGWLSVVVGKAVFI